MNAKNIDDRMVHITNLGVVIFDRLSKDFDFSNQLNNFIEDPIYSNDWYFMLPKREEKYIEPTTSMADFPLRVHATLSPIFL